MGKTIDTRVVELEFNNAQFESRVRESLTSLEKLRSAIDSKGFNTTALDKLQSSLSSTKLGGAITSMADNFKSGLGTVGDIIDSISDKLGGLKTAAAVAGGVLSAGLIGQAISGGKRRSQNIEQANFMLSGLMDAEKADKVMQQVKTSVRGTAYGMDEAARAAAQLAASGIEVGEAWDDNTKTGGELATSLRAIAGVAAMSGSAYSDIAQIFTTVAGNGRVMTHELNRIGMRGLNAKAALAGYLNVSQAEVAEMTREGEIDFQTFANAMSFAFGDQAKRANETFSGSLMNIKASLSRMGEQFTTPAYEFGKKIFQALLLGGPEDIGPIQQFEEVLKPISAGWKKALTGLGDGISGFITDVGNSGAITGLAELFSNVGGALENAGSKISGFVGFFVDNFSKIGDIGKNLFSTVVEPLKAFSDVFGELFLSKIQIDPAKMLDSILSISQRLRPAAEQIEWLKTRLKDVLQPLSNFIDLIGSLGKEAIDFALPKIPDIFPMFGDAIQGVKDKINNLGFDTNLFSGLGRAIQGSFADLKLIFSNGIPSFDDFIGFIERTKNRISVSGPEIVASLSTFAENVKNAAKEKISGIFESLPDMAAEFSSKVGRFAEAIDLDTIFSHVLDFFKSIPEKIASVFSEDGFLSSLNLAETIGKCFENVEFISDIGSTFSSAAGEMETASGKFSGISDNIKNACDGIPDALNSMREQVMEFFKQIGLDMENATVFIAGLLSVGFMTGIGLTVNRILGMVHGVQKVLDSTVGVLNSIKSIGTGLKDIAKNLKFLGIAGIILSIGASLIAFAIAVKILSTIPTDQLIASLVGVGVALLAFAAITKYLYKILTTGEGTKGLDALSKLGASLVMFAAALVLVAAACIAFQFVDPVGMLKAGIAAAALVGVAYALAKISDKFGSFLKISASLAAIGPTLLSIAIACAVFAFIPVEGMAKAGAALFALMLAMGAMAAMKATMGDLTGMTAAMMGIGASLIAIGVACMIFSRVQPEGIAIAVGAIVLLVLAVGALSKMKSRLGDITGMAAGMIALSFSLVIVAEACKRFASVEPAGTQKALIAMVGLGFGMALLAGISKYIGKIQGVAVALLATSAALVVVGVACMIFQNVDPGGFIKAMIALAMLVGAMMALAGVGAKASTFIGIAIGLGAMSVALAVFAATLIVLAAIPFDLLSRSLLALGVALAAVVVLGAVAGSGPVTVGLLALAAAVLVISIAVVIAAAGLNMFVVALAAAEAVGSSGATALAEAFRVLGAEIGNIVIVSLGLILLGVAIGVLGVGAAVGAVGILLFAAALAGLALVVAGAVIGILYVFNALPEGLSSLGETIGTAMDGVVGSIKDGLLNGLNNLIENNPLTQGLSALVDGAMNFFNGEGGDVSTKAAETGAKIPQDMASGVEEGKPDFLASVMGTFDGMNIIGEDGMLNLKNIVGTGGGDATSIFGNMFDPASMADGNIQEMMSNTGGSMEDFKAQMAAAGVELPEEFNAGMENLPTETSGIVEQTSADVTGALAAQGPSFTAAAQQASSGIPEGVATGMAPTKDRVTLKMNESNTAVRNFRTNLTGASTHAFGGVPNGVNTGMSGMSGKIRPKMNSAVSTVRGYRDEASSAGSSVGSNFGAGIAGGIGKYIQASAEAARANIRAAKAAADAEADSASPSKEMIKRGKWFVQGFAKGIADNTKLSNESSSAMVQTALGRVIEGYGEMASLLDSIDYNPTIRPVFDGTALRSGIQSANRMMLQNQVLAAGYAGRTYSAISAQAQTGTSNNITIQLNYEAGEDANKLAMDLGRALRSRVLMEGR